MNKKFRYFHKGISLEAFPRILPKKSKRTPLGLQKGIAFFFVQELFHSNPIENPSEIFQGIPVGKFHRVIIQSLFFFFFCNIHAGISVNPP